jgi:hypothetical protein
VSIRFVVAHRKDPNNVGDIASDPLQYFLPRDQYQTIDVANLREEQYPVDVPLILGGGGILTNSFLGDVPAKLIHTPDRQRLQDLAENYWQLANVQNTELNRDFNQKYHELIARTLERLPNNSSPKFIWGAGHNGSTDELEKIKYSKFMGDYRYVGIRDYFPDGGKYDWAPCASCMHPALRTDYAIKNDVIWFEHKKQMVKDFGDDPIPRFVNTGNNIEQTMEILGSANIILTNSYHGAYWGTLMGKRVVVVDSWSTKFHLMKHRPAFSNKKTPWREAIEHATVHHGAIDECRQATQTAWARIQGML